MTDTPVTLDWSLPPEQARLVDRVCNDFEAAWKDNTPPQIETPARRERLPALAEAAAAASATPIA